MLANHRVRKISGDIALDPDSGEKVWSNVTVECFSGRCDPLSNNPEPGFADGKKETSRFDSPRGVTVSSNGETFLWPILTTTWYEGLISLGL